jgi:hypothetical protein
MSWHPDDYASFRFEVSYERDEWLGVADQYRKSTLPGIAVEAGAAELPDHPWRQEATGKEDGARNYLEQRASVGGDA